MKKYKRNGVAHWKLFPKLWKYKGFDILVTHAPVRGYHDFDNDTHRGFDCFRNLIEKYQPKYLIHGHIHRNYGVNILQKSKLENTTVINAYEYCSFEYME